MTGGWNIWGTTGDTLRQFKVAKAAEGDAMAALSAEFPDVTVVSRHTLDASIIKMLGMKDGQVVEWVPADPKDRLTHAGGEPIDKPMKG